MPPLLDLNSVIMAIDANKVAASMEIAKAIFDSPSSEIEPSVYKLGIHDAQNKFTSLIPRANTGAMGLIQWRG